MSRLQHGAGAVIELVNAVGRLLLDRDDLRDKRHLNGYAEETVWQVLKTNIAHDRTRYCRTPNPHPSGLE